jgi:hypothetical protein
MTGRKRNLPQLILFAAAPATYESVLSRRRSRQPLLPTCLVARLVSASAWPEAKGSHVIFPSQPRAVAKVIERAAREAK